MLLIISVIIAYLLGSISSAILACKLMGFPDPRNEGSGNPGATNVLRFAGKKLAILVLIGDVLKGVIAVLLAKLIGVSPDFLGWVALAAFLGHLFPIFFQFKGGKGVATAIGGIFVVSWTLGLALVLTWLVTVLIFRYSSLGALVAALMAFVFGYWFLGFGNYLPIALMAVLLLLRHQQNIRNLLAGEEKKLQFKRSRNLNE